MRLYPSDAASESDYFETPVLHFRLRHCYDRGEPVRSFRYSLSTPLIVYLRHALTQDMLDSYQDKLQDCEEQLNTGTPDPYVVQIGQGICDVLSAKLGLAKPLQPDQPSATLPSMHCNTDTAVRLQVILLTTLGTAGPMVADQVHAILITRVYPVPGLIPVLGETTSIPRPSKLLALCQQLNGVDRNSKREIGNELGEPILGIWAAHRRLAANMKTMETKASNPLRKYLLNKTEDFASRIPGMTSSTSAPSNLILPLQVFCRFCWRFLADVAVSSTRPSPSAKLIAFQNVCLLGTGKLRDVDVLRDTQRYLQEQLVKVEREIRELRPR